MEVRKTRSAPAPLNPKGAAPRLPVGHPPRLQPRDYLSAAGQYPIPERPSRRPERGHCHCRSTTVVKETMEAIDKVVKPLIESAAEEAGAAAGVLSKVFGAAVGVVVELATAPATARDEDKLKDVKKKDDKGDKDKEHTKEPSPSKWDKHTKPHPSRTGDKLRDRPDWQPKKKKGGPRSPGSKRDKTDDD